MTNKETLMQQIKDMEVKLEEMKLELNKKEKWEPKLGDYGINMLGEVVNPVHKDTLLAWQDMGYTFDTFEKAEKAKKYYRFIHRLYKLAEELNEGWEPDWKNLYQKKYIVCYSQGNFTCELKWATEIFVPIFKDKETVMKAIEIFEQEEKYWEE